MTVYETIKKILIKNFSPKVSSTSQEKRQNVTI